jgi:hypothetical protein
MMFQLFTAMYMVWALITNSALSYSKGERGPDKRFYFNYGCAPVCQWVCSKVRCEDTRPGDNSG